jgi:hypothetical protein
MTSVGSIINGAFRLIKERPGAVMVWILIYLVMNAVTIYAMGPIFEMQAATMGSGDPSLAMADFWSTFGWIFLIQLAALLLFLIVFTATQRAVLRPQEGGPGFLRLGMDELRTIGLAVILFVLFYVGMIVVGLVMVAILGVAIVGASAGGGAATGGVLLGILITLLLICVAIWLYVRLSLAFPLTFLRRRIVIGESWRLTSGRFWTLLGAYLVLAIIVIILSTIVSTVAAGSYWSEIISKGFTPESMMEAARQQIERMSQLDMVTLLGLALNAVISGVSLALFGGAIATAARELAGDEMLAREFA